MHSLKYYASNTTDSNSSNHNVRFWLLWRLCLYLLNKNQKDNKNRIIRGRVIDPVSVITGLVLYLNYTNEWILRLCLYVTVWCLDRIYSNINLQNVQTCALKTIITFMSWFAGWRVFVYLSSFPDLSAQRMWSFMYYSQCKTWER